MGPAADMDAISCSCVKRISQKCFARWRAPRVPVLEMVLTERLTQRGSAASPQPKPFKS